MTLAGTGADELGKMHVASLTHTYFTFVLQAVIVVERVMLFGDW